MGIWRVGRTSEKGKLEEIGENFRVLLFLNQLPVPTSSLSYYILFLCDLVKPCHHLRPTSVQLLDAAMTTPSVHLPRVMWPPLHFDLKLLPTMMASLIYWPNRFLFHIYQFNSQLDFSFGRHAQFKRSQQSHDRFSQASHHHQRLQQQSAVMFSNPSGAVLLWSVPLSYFVLRCYVIVYYIFRNSTFHCLICFVFWVSKCMQQHTFVQQLVTKGTASSN